MDLLRRIRNTRFWIILGIIGPGIITASVDNDAGGIAIYSIAGAHYGYMLLWTLIPIAVFLFVIQEMSARMGVVTGKGLADIVRESYGVKTTFYLMLFMFLTNVANTVSEFAGLAAGFEIFGVSRYVSVPLCAAAIWLLVIKGTYNVVEKVFLLASAFYLTYAVSAFMTQPEWSQVLEYAVKPSFKYDPSYILLLVGLVGTTISPWMQFYIQSSIVEKGLQVKEYKITRYDVVLGSVVTALVAFFIMIACAKTLFPADVRIESAKDAALALFPLAGKYAGGLFAFGLINASLFAASILPLSTAYSICEGMGWEAGVNKSFKEAPHFMWLYTFMIVVGALFILIPKIPLIPVMVFSQVVNGVILPVVLVFILKLINKKEIMGEHTNSKLFNVLALSCAGVMIILSLVMVMDMLFPSMMH